MRFVSLIASSTETICALGHGDKLVGRSHECDFPASVESLPVCTAAKFELSGTSLEIDRRARETLATQGSVYRTDTRLLEGLLPDLIVTQEQCEICAVVLRDVEKAAEKFANGRPNIVALAPSDLESVYDGIWEIATALDDSESGLRLVDDMRSRIRAASRLGGLSARSRPSVACVEWIEPLMLAGNWIPELVELAGGRDVLGPQTRNSATIGLESLKEADPEIIVVMLCGWDIEKTIAEAEPLFRSEAAQSLRAVRTGHVYYANGNHYFNRPGPRLSDSVEILTEIFYPDVSDYGYKGKAWIQRDAVSSERPALQG
jgi:iron complex transport system substrate-binding protein